MSPATVTRQCSFHPCRGSSLWRRSSPVGGSLRGELTTVPIHVGGARSPHGPPRAPVPSTWGIRGVPLPHGAPTAPVPWSSKGRSGARRGRWHGLAPLGPVHV